MSSMVKPACLYLVYLAAFLVFFGLIGRENSAEIFNAVGRPFLEAPYRSSPEHSLYDVRGSEEVYEWISGAFLPNLYSEVDYEDADSTSSTTSEAISLEGICTQGTTSGVDALMSRSELYTSEQSSTNSCPATTVGTSAVQVSLGEYNRVWLGRLTLKRRKLASHMSKAFSNAYSTVPSITRLNPKGSTSHEDTSDFASAEGDVTYSYDKGGGWRGAGGFVQYFNFSNYSAVVEKLDKLHEDAWFDLRQGSLTLDSLFYNGNLQSFLHISFTFEHDFAGKTKVLVEASQLDLTLHDSASAQAWVRFATYVLILGLFLYFVRQEVDELSGSGVWEYLSNLTSVLHCAALFLCAYCIILYLQIVVSYTYLHLNFIDSGDLSVKQFEDLSNLSHYHEHVLAVMAATTFFMCIRGVAVLAILIPQTKLVVYSLNNVKYQLFAYVTTVIITLSAFQLAGYFFFGSRVEAFSAALYCVISCVKMLLKEANIERLADGDSTMSTTFFLVFHIFFLVIHQILLCILIKGYLEEREAWKKLAELNNTPAKRILRKFWAIVSENSVCLHRFFSWCMPRTGMVSARINHGQVSLLRQRRATRLRTRTVIYEQKQDEEFEMPEILKDIHFNVVKPTTRDGLLQFYASYVSPNGQAYEAGLREGYRLIEIQTPTLKDREAFRHVPSEAASTNRQHPDLLDPIRNLKKFPVTLIFEGQPRAVAWECIGLLLYVLVFLFFAVVVTRNTDTLQMHVSQMDAMMSPWWASCSLKRTMSFEDISQMDHIDRWVSAAIVDNSFQCSSLLDYNGAISCDNVDRSANLTGDRREGWYLWQGPDKTTPTQQPYEAKTTVALGYYPPAAGGLSLGFIPHTPPAVAGSSGTQCSTEATNTLEEKVCSCSGQVRFGVGTLWSEWVDVSSSIECIPSNFGMDETYASRVCVCRDDRARTTQVIAFDYYNVGVMPNNHVRLTVQQQCFVKNPVRRWQGGAPWTLASRLLGTCSDDNCMKAVSEDKSVECYNKNGVLQASYLQRTGEASGVSYRFKEGGSYQGLGGFVVGFGNTRGEAATVAAALNEDEILATAAASAVFEYILYNANFDLFELVTIRFNLRGSGQVDKSIDTTVFPLRVFTMGSVDTESRSNIVNWVLFFAYCLACLIFLLAILSDLFTQYNITKALLRPTSQFLVDFLVEEPWNLMDVIILILNFVIIDALVRFMLMESSASVRAGVASWTGDYTFTLQSNLLTEDQFENLKNAGALWRRFCRNASFNGMLLLIRVIKYSGAASRMRMVMLALGKAIMELSMVVSLHLCLTAGFAMMWFIHFGIIFPSAATLADSILVLSMFHVGRFGVDHLVSWSPVFSVLFVPVFYLVFSLLINMMLAIMVYCWREVRQDAQPYLGSLKKKKGGKSSETLAGTGEGSDAIKLDPDFWRELGLLQSLSTIDEHGRLKPAPREKRLGFVATASYAKNEEGAEEEGNMMSMTSGHSDRRFKFDTTDDQNRFQKVFRKAVLELVSNLSKNHRGGPLAMAGHSKVGTPSARKSRQLANKAAGSPNSEKEKEKDELEIGIIEVEVTQDDVIEIDNNLGRKLETLPDFTLELWLDALVTALEFESIETLQRILLPPPQIMPKKQQEWNAFKAKKVDRELRLECFFKLLQLKASKARSEYLKGMALEKSRILKEQSLVMTDYWESLEEQLEKTRHDLA